MSEKVIERLLSPLSNITYSKEKLQVIVIDDASSDKTGKIADEYKNKYSFIDVLHRDKSNGRRGKASAMNHGFSQKKISKNELLKNEFKNKDISTIDFSKKLLGQIVFIYFLQKKGWLGVQKDEKAAFKPWGSGPKNFLRRLFSKEIIPYKNFFNEILEPLFYEALSTERDEDYYRLFKCKIPFLNGGLFEPINDYNWTEINIDLSNDLFDEIFSTFDRFNFTVKEDEPLDKEVAVDPEMLGKVFENLLEVTDRKSKGAFYTPREIVHYMCQQSLISYLSTKITIDKEDIEQFIEIGDAAFFQILKEQEDIKKRNASSNEKSIPDSIKQHHLLLDRLLEEIKIVDPAVGSGAFLVSMMTEIVKARSILSLYKDSQENDSNQITNYQLKRTIIENCLYGVDIEPSAVEITKLRFWLSLIVDEPDMKNIEPLPNLDHKIMCGNSLLEEYEGIKLFDERLLGQATEPYPEVIKKIDGKISSLRMEKGEIALGKRKGCIESVDKEMKKWLRIRDLEQKNSKNSRDMTLQESLRLIVRASKKKLSQMKELEKLYFHAQNRKLKNNLREKIDEIQWALIEETLKELGNEKAIEKVEHYKKNKTKPFFVWKLYFSEVFQRDKPGFDIVIGNPPYGFRNVLSKDDKEYYRKVEDIEFKSGDSAELFCIKCFENLTRTNGVLTFIIPKKSLYGDSWEGLRANYWKKYTLLFVLDSSKAFEKVLLEASAFSLKKAENQNSDVKLAYLRKDDTIKMFARCKKQDIFSNIDTVRMYRLLYPSELILKIESKQANIQVQGKLGLAIGQPFYSEERTEYKLLKGIDIEKWRLKGHRYLKNKQKLNWENAKQFLVPKIVAQRIVAHIENPVPHIKLMAAYDFEGILITNTLMSFELGGTQINPKFWMAYVNSKFVSWFTYNFIYSRAIRTMDFYNFYIKQIPIPEKILDAQNQKIFTFLADQILALTNTSDYPDNLINQAKVTTLENEIDRLVYSLYDLTDKEIDTLNNCNDGCR